MSGGDIYVDGEIVYTRPLRHGQHEVLPPGITAGWGATCRIVEGLPDFDPDFQSIHGPAGACLDLGTTVAAVIFSEEFNKDCRPVVRRIIEGVFPAGYTLTYTVARDHGTREIALHIDKNRACTRLFVTAWHQETAHGNHDDLDEVDDSEAFLEFLADEQARRRAGS